MSSSKDEIKKTIYKDIKSEIVNNKLVHGDKLTVITIAKKYNINKIHVSTALQWLTNEGLIEHCPRKGYFVIGIDSGDFLEIGKLRELLEGQLLRRFVDLATEEELEAAEDILQRKIVFLQNNMLSNADKETENLFNLIHNVDKYQHISGLHKKYHQYLMHIIKNDFQAQEGLDITLSTTILLQKGLMNRDVNACLAWVSARYENLVATKMKNKNIKTKEELPV